jgi:hypothetical protein
MQKNSIDNPNCLYGEIESTYHYLFKCPKYTRARNILFRKLFQLLNIRPSEHLLLFGSPDLDIDSNIIVFTTVHQYIPQSKRFSLNSDTSCDLVSRVQSTISLFFPFL